jgi:hypothetical protein
MKNLKPPPFNLPTEGRRGAGFLPLTLCGEKPALRPSLDYATPLRILGLSEGRIDTKQRFSTNAPARRVGAALARLWDADMRCKRRAKGGVREQRL